MQINSITNLVNNINVLSSQSLAKVLPIMQVGQVFKAIVLDQPQSGLIRLSINGQNITAKTDLALIQGERLELKVASLDKQVQLKIINRNVATDTISQTIRTALPKQNSISNVLQQAIRLTKPAQAEAVKLPDVLQAQVTKLATAIPTRPQVETSSGLQRAIQNSGVLLESKLASQTSNLEHSVQKDIKANLLSLAKTIGQLPVSKTQTTTTAVKTDMPSNYVTAETKASTQTTQRASSDLPVRNHAEPPLRGTTPMPETRIKLPQTNLPNFEMIAQELGKQAEASLARVQLHQLASIPSETQPNASWLIEVPVRDKDDVDIFQFRIDRETDPDGEEMESQS